MMTKKWQPYPTYKDSGVEWLGKIPEHWKVKKCKQLSLIKRGASPRPIDDPSFFDDDGAYSWVRISDVTASNKYLETSEQKLSELGKSKSIALEPGELFVSICATVGKPIITNIKCCIHDGFVYFPFLKENREYLFYIFSGGELYKGVGKQGTQLNLNTDIIGDIKLPIPPLPEQQKIAQFLDQETSKIDKLITKKERLIKLLKEKRTALISHAVTKGLNPDVPMKDSGVEWLGEIPEHWEIVPLRSVLEQRIEYNIGRKTENILSVIKDVGVVNYEDREASGNKKSENIEQYKIIYPSDIVVNRMNLIFGSVGIAREYGASSTEYYVLKPKSNKVCQEYYGHIFCSKSFQLSLVGIGKGILFHRMRIYSEELKKILFPFPPLEEQKLINEYLIQNLNEINHLSDKLNTSIDHLKEYRTALISAAVTGKIDVREH
ncbi:restriction endonuclease subunit S [Microcystis aeruginosa]|uniref:Restriction modification system DNA specificity domain protein n=1 Tax=Microcystis aeruginosa NIES-3807 TaxID=2517785 RepID=A0AAD3AYD0_MICAE|nr:restriction endonuclease subunit S [Microcystis aeruginosa]GCL58067.1 restriction modification system DNA specificity domain protein [Microcystis aeruginosa NIES-3807]